MKLKQTKYHRFLSLLFLFFYHNITYSQNIESYNILYKKTYLETANNDFPQALAIADSLYKVSKTPILKVRSLMLIASLHQQKGQTIKAIETALLAESIVNTISDPNWKVRIFGFLATQFRIATLYSPAKQYTDKAEEIAKAIKHTPTANTTLGLLMQERAYYDMASQKYKEAIGHIHKSQQYLKDTQHDNNFFAIENEQLLGLNNYLLGNKNEALKHYKTALSKNKEAPNNHIIALIHNGMTNIYLDERDLTQASFHLNEALLLEKSSQYLQLKKEILKSAVRYYSLTKNIEQMLAIGKRRDSIQAEIYKSSAEFVDRSYPSVDQQKAVKEPNIIHTFGIFSFIIILPILIYLFAPHLKWFKKKSNPKVVLEKYVLSVMKDDKDAVTTAKKEDDNNILQHEELAKEEPLLKENYIPDNSSHTILPEQTTNKIMLKLNEFERKKLYIKRNVSLSHLAIHCDTNIKYLSVVINNYKKKDFNNYINELRVNYIIEKLKNNPYYRRVKVSVLAEESGFSSQSKFALHFKKVTSVSPSEFIKSLPSND